MASSTTALQRLQPSVGHLEGSSPPQPAAPGREGAGVGVGGLLSMVPPEAPTRRYRHSPEGKGNRYLSSVAQKGMQVLQGFCLLSGQSQAGS